MKQYLKDKNFRAGLLITGIMILVILIGLVWTPYDPNAMSGAEKLQGPSAAHWFGTDDLDLHCVTPDGSHIYYSNPSGGGGYLDVDMNISGDRTEAIEHIYFDQPKIGVYQFYIVNYTDRTEGDVPADVTVTINNNEEGQNDPSKKSVLVSKTVSMGGRSPTWTFVIEITEDPETGAEYVEGVPGETVAN